LPLDRLRNIEQALVFVKNLNIVQYRVVVSHGEFGVHSHDSHVWYLFTSLLIQ
jgi:hypothetical protein